MDVRHIWDDGGNLINRYDAISSDNETFTYDFLDRLTAVSGPYTESYSYNEISNIVTRNGISYSYDSTQPHAVDSVGDTDYYYDANGNMTTRGGQTLTWDAENHPVSISGNGTTAYFFYDGDGNRVKKTEGGETILYINKYYEKNLTTGNVTSYYYLGGKLVAMKQDTELRYVHQDHLSGTALVTSANGTSLGIMKYYPYGETRTGSVPTDKLFTGQRLDDTGLYYYNARYYDPTIGRFISPDTIIPNPTNPQAFNRYSYCLNNPLKYTDPSGHQSEYLILYNYVMEYGTRGTLPANIASIIAQGTSGGIAAAPTPTPPSPSLPDFQYSSSDSGAANGQPSLPIDKNETPASQPTDTTNYVSESVPSYASEGSHAYQVIGIGLMIVGGELTAVGVSCALAGILTTEVGVGIPLAVGGAFIAWMGLNLFDVGLQMATNGRYTIHTAAWLQWPF
jgi:RHS repeat-associated protein